MQLLIYIIARRHGPQEKEEEGKEEEEVVRSTGVPDSHLRGPRAGDSEGLADDQACGDGDPQ